MVISHSTTGQTVPYLLIANQRSGTNMLRSVLKDHPEILSVGEIFHNLKGYDSDPMNFHCWLSRSGTMNGRPYGPHNIFFFLEFVAYLQGIAGPQRRVIMDIKYNSLHQIFKNWSNTRFPLLEALTDLRFPVIHLVRQDIARTVLSALVARKTNIYVLNSGVQRAVREKIEINIQELKGGIEGLSGLIRGVNYFLTRYRLPHITITYESLLSPGDSEYARLASFLHISSFTELKPSTQRILPSDLSGSIANWPAVRDAIASVRSWWDPALGEAVSAPSN